MRAFSEILVSPPGVELLRVDVAPAQGSSPQFSTGQSVTA